MGIFPDNYRPFGTIDDELRELQICHKQCHFLAFDMEKFPDF